MDDSSDKMSIDSFNSDSFDFEYEVSSDDDSVSLDTDTYSDATISGDDELERIFYWANPAYEPYDDEKRGIKRPREDEEPGETFHQAILEYELLDDKDFKDEKRGMKRPRENVEDDKIEYPNKNQKTNPSPNASYMAWYAKEHEKETRK